MKVKKLPSEIIESLSEITSILKQNYYNDPDFKKNLSDILIKSGNKNLNIIIDSIVTKL